MDIVEHQLYFSAQMDLTFHQNMVEVGICKNYVTTFRIYIFLLELTGTQIQ
jgi:hypothetical protein